MKYQIITVGSELTLGLSINTNSAYIAKTLGQEGYSCTRQTSVPDDIGAIGQAINDALSYVDLVIVTGGLGPTSDDVTREGICEAVGCKLKYKSELADVIKERYGERASSLPLVTFRQAYLPEGAEPIIPTIGSAPGIVLESGGKYVVSLPGVPREMRAMIEENIIPWLETKFGDGEAYKVRVLRTTAKSEAALQEAIHDIIESLDDVTVGILAFPGEIQLQLVGRGDTPADATRAAKDAEKLFVKRLGSTIFGFDEETLEEVVGNLLKKHGLTLGTAESCTGGLISKKITDVPGSSSYFLGGVISYSNDIKRSLLDVSSQTLLRHGAVSSATALEMAIGARERTGSEIGLGVTGIAGPDGGTSDKPVGLVYVGLSHKTTNFSNKYVFFGSRETVRLKGANAALDMVRYFILDNYESPGGDAS